MATFPRSSVTTPHLDIRDNMWVVTSQYGDGFTNTDCFVSQEKAQKEYERIMSKGGIKSIDAIFNPFHPNACINTGLVWDEGKKPDNFQPKPNYVDENEYFEDKRIVRHEGDTTKIGDTVLYTKNYNFPRPMSNFHATVVKKTNTPPTHSDYVIRMYILEIADGNPAYELLLEMLDNDDERKINRTPFQFASSFRNFEIV